MKQLMNKIERTEIEKRIDIIEDDMTTGNRRTVRNSGKKDICTDTEGNVIAEVLEVLD